MKPNICRNMSKIGLLGLFKKKINIKVEKFVLILPKLIWRHEHLRHKIQGSENEPETYFGFFILIIIFAAKVKITLKNLFPVQIPRFCSSSVNHTLCIFRWIKCKSDFMKNLPGLTNVDEIKTWDNCHIIITYLPFKSM